MDPLTLLGTSLGLGFAAGMRLYATVLAIGLALVAIIRGGGAWSVDGVVARRWQ